ncbi:hypothetical protein [Treponema sp.]|uniref:hypothetical protein n=1 Tax=Treponema sp. TaxID=166 RepID=UPI0025D75E9D|nr:hypothetical protein [Treponema sp.]MCR5219186.1 hypothetical protein [Treponema sp.]
MKAKKLSLVAMIGATVWIAVLTILKSCKIIDITIKDIVESAAAMVAIWCPTYVSLWLDKIKLIRFGDNGDVEKC